MPPPPPRAAASPPRRALAALGAVVVTLAAAAIAVPLAMVAAGTRRAAACFAAIEAPRGPALPGCDREAWWLSLPSRAPWTRHAATYRAEEIGARAATAAYADAAIGRPDREALDRAANGVEIAANVVASGSRRISLEDLGPPLGAPHLGREAARLGDRRTLVGRADRWGDWYVRLAALRAALTEGDLTRATAIAEQYAGFDPRDEDLRTTVAAVLCLGDAPKRGVELLAHTQHDRATRRYAAMARNWGDVGAVIVACAARAGEPPPPRPESPEAGAGDALPVRAALEVRVAEAEGDADRARRGAEVAGEVLGLTAREPAARLGLLAVSLLHGAPIDAPRAAALARARADEGETKLSTGPLLSADWLPAPGLARPVIAGAALARAATRAAELAAGPKVSDDDRAELGAAAGALAFEAARELAAAGDAPAAIAILDRLGPAAAGAQDGVALALARSSAWAIAGDPVRALAHLDALGRAGLEGAVPAARAATALQRAELLAALGRRDEAARAAALADDAAAEAARPAAPPAAPDGPPALHPFPVLDARARWTRLALARPQEGGPLRPGAAPAPAPPPGSAGYPWPWVGFANTGTPWARLDHTALGVALARWDAARAAPPPARRALRYAALQRRGDAPPALAAYLAVAAELLGPGEGDVEVWLDALLSFDARRFSYRHHARARADAARWRGDAESATLWQRRYEALRRIAADPERAEIARYLGI